MTVASLADCSADHLVEPWVVTTVVSTVETKAERSDEKTAEMRAASKAAMSVARMDKSKDSKTVAMRVGRSVVWWADSKAGHSAA